MDNNKKRAHTPNDGTDANKRHKGLQTSSHGQETSGDKKRKDTKVRYPIRPGHAWYCGTPGTYTDDDLRRLANKWICCSGCTMCDFHRGKCHTCKIVTEFKDKFPDLPPPTFVSAATTTIEGKGGLREVLIQKDAVWCATRTARGAPTSRELNIRIPFSKFGNPDKLRKWAEDKQKRQNKSK